MWREFAVCRGMRTTLFFPESNKPGESHSARSACASCPVADPCLAYALAHGERGIWGGTSEEQRRKMLNALGNERGAYVHRLESRAS